MRMNDAGIAAKAHRQTIRDCREYAARARDQGDEETARIYDGMAARAARNIMKLDHGEPS